jgi:hypothetical protein
MTTSFPRLSALMGAYFHQDFDLLYDSDNEAIVDYAATHSREDVRQAVEEIDELLDDLADGLLKRFQNDVSRWDFIIGANDDEARIWLLKARRLLADV